jgi:hypothetical protein
VSAILRFAPVFEARILDDPSLAREIMVQRGAFTTAGVPLVVVAENDLDAEWCP